MVRFRFKSARKVIGYYRDGAYCDLPENLSGSISPPGEKKRYWKHVKLRITFNEICKKVQMLREEGSQGKPCRSLTVDHFRHWGFAKLIPNRRKPCFAGFGLAGDEERQERTTQPSWDQKVDSGTTGMPSHQRIRPIRVQVMIRKKLSFFIM